MICHSFSCQSNLPSSREMQNTGLKKKECQDDLFRGRRLGGGGGGEMGQKTGRPFTLLKAVLMNSTWPATHSIPPSQEAQCGDKSNNSQTADSFLLVLNLGSKYIPQDKKNIRRNQKELF